MQSEMVFNITEMVEQLSNNSYEEDDEQEEKVVREMFQSEKDETFHSIQQHSELKSFFKMQFLEKYNYFGYNTFFLILAYCEKTTEKFEVSKRSIAISPAGDEHKFSDQQPPLQKPSSNVKPEILAKPTQKTSSSPPSQTKMSWFELIAILLIFCLILVALNVMWTNFFKTMFICCLSFPILRWMGRI